MKQIILTFLLFLFLFTSVPPVHGGEAILILTHPQLPVSKISVSELSAIYLKKKSFWGDQTPIRPIDWKEGSAPRKAFLRIIDKTESELAQYWMAQKLHTGRNSPLQLNKASSICDLCSAMEGAICYILPEQQSEGSCANARYISLE